jgi:1-acyl-sn-glycerol-3-phosphate acyltransferase
VNTPALGAPAEGPDAPPWRLARFLRPTFGRLALALYRTRVFGAEHLPADGRYLLAGNHVSYLDPILLWCVAPRPTHFIARQDLFDRAVVGWGLRHLWSFPISRGEADREAIQRATVLLKIGEPVGIFPEGTRRRVNQDRDAELGHAYQGVSFIALRAGVPIVPVAISGTEKALPRGAWLPRFPRVTIRYAEPVCAQDFSQTGRREKMAAMTAEVMHRIAEERELAEKG